jgi:hypothetical protein
VRSGLNNSLELIYGQAIELGVAFNVEYLNISHNMKSIHVTYSVSLGSIQENLLENSYAQSLHN